jgi:hypothetical protein
METTISKVHKHEEFCASFCFGHVQRKILVFPLDVTNTDLLQCQYHVFYFTMKFQYTNFLQKMTCRDHEFRHYIAVHML